jgi:hypothetical protein
MDQEGNDTFLYNEAIDAYGARDPGRAQNCLEKAMLVRHGSRLSTADRAQFFKLLLHMDKDLLTQVSADFEYLWSSCRKQAEERLREHDARGLQGA